MEEYNWLAGADLCWDQLTIDHSSAYVQPLVDVHMNTDSPLHPGSPTPVQNVYHYMFVPEF